MSIKIKCKFYGFPEVEKIIGGKEIDLEIEGNTLEDLQQYLERTYGKSLKKTFASQILKNGKQWLKMKERDHYLKDGDNLSFLLMIPGG